MRHRYHPPELLTKIFQGLSITLCHRKRKNRIPKPQRKVHLWAPADLENKPKRESELMEKIQVCINELENSDFSRSFFYQIRTPPVKRKLLEVLGGSERKMQMVIYGIGSIESSERSRTQLSLAILMKKRFDWVGDVEVFDPVISATESEVMESLGCSVLSFNEHCRRQVVRPTLFFMPYCDEDLYSNLMRANWAFDRLTRFSVLGNSFTSLEDFSSYRRNRHHVSRVATGHMVRVGRFTQEFEITVGSLEDEYRRCFNGLSWHFFSPADDETLKLPTLNI